MLDYARPFSSAWSKVSKKSQLISRQVRKKALTCIYTSVKCRRMSYNRRFKETGRTDVLAAKKCDAVDDAFLFLSATEDRYCDKSDDAPVTNTITRYVCL